jgi:hypothetical protein
MLRGGRRRIEGGWTVRLVFHKSCVKDYVAKRTGHCPVREEVTSETAHAILDALVKAGRAKIMGEYGWIEWAPYLAIVGAWVGRIGRRVCVAIEKVSKAPPYLSDVFGGLSLDVVR